MTKPLPERRRKERQAMFEKVNPAHPDKIADRIAGALVDYAYTKEENPKIAVEVLIGHGTCHIITETSVSIPDDFIDRTVERINGERLLVLYDECAQDAHLARNQKNEIRCGDNGIFKGVPVTDEQKELSQIARRIFELFPTDGKYVLDQEHDKLIICQSQAADEYLRVIAGGNTIINPLGYWTGGTNVDTGATNRKLGSDMGDAVTGGGLHGKDLSKADVAVNIYAHLKAQQEHREVKLSCAIGDATVDGRLYADIVKIAREYIDQIGGFERLAEWGLI